jgi:hypothetical protein
MELGIKDDVDLVDGGIIVVVGNVVDFGIVVVVVVVEHTRVSHTHSAGRVEQSCEECQCQHHPRKAVISWTHQTICVGRSLQVAVIRAFSRRGDWSRLFFPHQILNNDATNGGIEPVNWLPYKSLRKRSPIAGERTFNNMLQNPPHDDLQVI